MLKDNDLVFSKKQLISPLKFNARLISPKHCFPSNAW
jgi:hypothetical protein